MLKVLILKYLDEYDIPPAHSILQIFVRFGLLCMIKTLTSNYTYTHFLVSSSKQIHSIHCIVSKTVFHLNAEFGFPTNWNQNACIVQICIVQSIIILIIIRVFKTNCDGIVIAEVSSW